MSQSMVSTDDEMEKFENENVVLCGDFCEADTLLALAS